MKFAIHRVGLVEKELLKGVKAPRLLRFLASSARSLSLRERTSPNCACAYGEQSLNPTLACSVAASRQLSFRRPSVPCRRCPNLPRRLGRSACLHSYIL